MRKLLVILILMSFMFAEKVRIIKAVNLRTKPFMQSNSQVITYVVPSDEYEVVDKTASYHYVKITSGSDHVGKEGWMWVERIKDGKVIIEGCSLRSEPIYIAADKNKYRIAKVRVGANVEIIKTKYVSYKINRNINSKWKEGWVSAGFVELIKE